MSDKPDLKNLGIRGADIKEMLDLLKHVFLSAAEYEQIPLDRQRELNT